MAGPLITIDIMGDKQLVRGFSRFADEVKDLREPFGEIVKQFHAIEQKQFETEGGYGSGGWHPLASSTLERKRREGFPNKILVRTRQLMDSLTGKSSASVVESRPLQLRIGTTLGYARIHQQGLGLPTRPVIDLTEGDKMAFMKTIQRYLVNQIGRVF